MVNADGSRSREFAIVGKNLGFGGEDCFSGLNGGRYFELLWKKNQSFWVAVYAEVCGHASAKILKPHLVT